MKKAKAVLEQNQYPQSFYEAIIKQTLDEIMKNKMSEDLPTVSKQVEQQPDSILETNEIPKHPIFIQYRGKCTEEFAQCLHKIKAPCNIVMTLRKISTLLPSLKAPVEKPLKSGVVYKFQCAVCPAAYVGQTARHILTRYKEHLKEPSPVAKHTKECGSTCSWEDITILDQTTKDYSKLLTREALWIEEMKPSLNTQEDFRNRTLTLKLF